MSRRSVLLSAALVVVWAQSGRAALREVRFEDELIASGSGPIVVVQVPEDAVLVFDKGPYDLDGRDLLIYATNVVVRGGDVRVESWEAGVYKPSPGGVPAPPPAPGGCGGTRCTGHTGSPGSRGNVGETGEPGSLLYLNVDTFKAETSSRLVVAANGQTGGKGQHGGAGGDGGPGGPGENANSNNFCEKPCPTSGGTGGQGGRGGPAGTGGTGGIGGSVKLSAVLWTLQQGGSAELAASAPGGNGGPAGDPGLAGTGGPGGPRGAGATVCICNDVPPPGPHGSAGPSGTDPANPSTAGGDGSVVEIQ